MSQISNQVWRGQNQEDRIVAEYFSGDVGNLLSIGENNGRHLSNCRALIEMGWSGIMVEPSPDAFLSLFTLYYDHPNVWCFNAAISDYTGKAVFYESGEHLGIGDTALLSTLDKNELKRWEGTNNTFEETEVLVWDFSELQKNVRNNSNGRKDKYQFISIDAEGVDVKILHQMDLRELDCWCLCIEHNGNPETFHRIECHAQDFGMKLLAKTPENVIYVR